MEPKIAIFISYSWENENIMSFVKWLALLLKKYDFDVKLDQLDVFPGSNLQEFMKNGLDNSKYVLSICTDSYKSKMDNPETGVGTEINHLKQTKSKKNIIAITDKSKPTTLLPTIFEDDFYLPFDFNIPNSKDNFEQVFSLLNKIKQEDLDEPFSDVVSPFKDYATTVSELRLENSILDMMQFSPDVKKSKVEFYHAHNNGEYAIGYRKMEIITKWSTCGNDSVYAYRKNISKYNLSIIPKLETIDSIHKISDFYEYERFNNEHAWEVTIGDGLLWINENDIAAVAVILNVVRDNNPAKCLVEFEYKILNPIENISLLEESD